MFHVIVQFKMSNNILWKYLDLFLLRKYFLYSMRMNHNIRFTAVFRFPEFSFSWETKYIWVHHISTLSHITKLSHFLMIHNTISTLSHITKYNIIPAEDTPYYHTLSTKKHTITRYHTLHHHHTLPHYHTFKHYQLY